MMRNFLIVFLFLLGIFLPTSINYIILEENVTGLYAVILCAVLFMWKLKDAEFPIKISLIGLLIIFILLFSTWISPFNKYSIGALPPVIAFSILFCLDLNKFSLGERTFKLFTIINVFFLLLGFCIVLDVQFVKDFFLKYYNAYYQNLLPNMFSQNKPVLFFSSHSRGAFHLFLFFIISFIVYKHLSRPIYLFFCFGYIYLILNLDSNTAYMFFFLACPILLFHLLKNKFRQFVISLSVISVVVALKIQDVMKLFSDLRFELQSTLNSQRNGLTGRFGEGGQLIENLNYIMENPFRPVGLGYSNDLFFSDNGMVLYTLRGTIFLTILIYLGFFLFLKRNLNHNYQIYLLFLAFFLMDLAAPSLTYFRTQFILPLLIVFIRSVSDEKCMHKVKFKTRPRKRYRIVWDKAS